MDNKRSYKFSDEERKVIQTIADATEIEVRGLLPALDDELVLTVTAGKYVIAQTGEAGLAGGLPKTSFMVGVVSEGMAVAFARDFSGERAPWGKYPHDIEDWVSELQNLPTGARYNEWMFRHLSSNEIVLRLLPARY